MLLFPPVNSGGLIEARNISERCSPGHGFPPVNSGGLIEASPFKGNSDAGSPGFPPVNSGGLIEADIYVNARYEIRERFRR